MALCKCGCMQEVSKGSIFVRGHNSPFIGRKHNEESRLRMSLSHVGKPSNRKGIKMSLEQRNKISNTMTGKRGQGTPNWGHKHSEETKKKLSDINKGKKQSEELIRKRTDSRKGYRHSAETINKISMAKMGAKNPTWNGGSSFYPYCPKFTQKVKEDIRTKYGRKCVLCNKGEKENGVKLSVHHVTYEKMDGCNGKDFELVPLCISCHSKTNHDRINYAKNITEKIVGFGVDVEL